MIFRKLCLWPQGIRGIPSCLVWKCHIRIKWGKTANRYGSASYISLVSVCSMIYLHRV